jgi:hypothetical protein
VLFFAKCFSTLGKVFAECPKKVIGKEPVTPGIEGTKPGASHICAREDNTYNNRVHRDKCHKYHKCTYYIAEVLQKNK